MFVMRKPNVESQVSCCKDRQLVAGKMRRDFLSETGGAPRSLQDMPDTLLETKMSITSDEVNFLVYRYLLESGFQHSAFTFGLESNVHQSGINGTLVPPGALISIIKKGLEYVGAEVSIGEDGSIIEDAPSLSLVDAVAYDSLGSKGGLAVVVRSDSSSSAVKRQDSIAKVHHGGGDPMDVDKDTRSIDHPPSLVKVLRGHQSEVFTCAWSPVANVIVSGSGDSTARLWTITNDGVTQEGDTVVLTHTPLQQSSSSSTTSNSSGGGNNNRDVTTVHWSPDGSQVATGSYDGVARLWNRDGELSATLTQHSGPIFALKWNSKGNYIVTGGVDKTAVVWDVSSATVKQCFTHHKEPTLDVDWQSNTCFASCSADTLIHVYRLNSDKPIRTFQGHKKGVNVIKWDPSGGLLASCSDDNTAKIWNMKQDGCVHDLKEHTGDIYTLQWSPSTSSSSMLATASFDSTVRLWEVERGTCLYTLHHHQDPVYSVAFSPDGKLLASGSFDKWLYIWSTGDGSLVRRFKGGSGIYEVCWNMDGTKLAASFYDNTLCVLDLKTLPS